jgi:hypothetical protein
MSDDQARALRVGLAQVLADDRARDAARDRHPSTSDRPFTVDPSTVAWAS